MKRRNLQSTGNYYNVYFVRRPIPGPASVVGGNHAPLVLRSNLQGNRQMIAIWQETLEQRCAISINGYPFI